MNKNGRCNLNFSIKKLENGLSRGSQPMGTPPVPFRIQPSTSEHSLGTDYWFIVVGDLEDPDPEPIPCTIFLGVDDFGRLSVGEHEIVLEGEAGPHGGHLKGTHK